jgi:hypothetical protein
MEDVVVVAAATAAGVVDAVDSAMVVEGVALSNPACSASLREGGASCPTLLHAFRQQLHRTTAEVSFFGNDRLRC